MLFALGAKLATAVTLRSIDFKKVRVWNTRSHFLPLETALSRHSR